MWRELFLFSLSRPCIQYIKHILSTYMVINFGIMVGYVFLNSSKQKNEETHGIPLNDLQSTLVGNDGIYTRISYINTNIFINICLL